MRVTVVADGAGFLSPLKDRTDIAWRTCAPRDFIADADLFIWDYAPGLDLRAYVDSRSVAQHLILIDHKFLESLADIQGSACVLLKPVSAFRLRAFVDMAFKAWQTNGQAQEAEKLRHDRDALLQYVLEVNLKLQEYDQERSNFLARALHDFRAPLTALHGYCGLLSEGKLGRVSDAQQELLNRMSYSTKRLTRLAGGTLELLLQGRVERCYNIRPGDIHRAVALAMDDVYPYCRNKRLTIDSRLSPPEGILSFEAERIQQVLVNLLENSCKFAPDGGVVRIRGFGIDPGVLETRAYQIDVSDSGPGVSPELVDRIFEEFASYSGVRDRSAGGLGLAICKQIVTAHQGAIWATPSDQGGRFSFVLPCGPLAEQDLSSASPECELERQMCARQ